MRLIPDIDSSAVQALEMLLAGVHDETCETLRLAREMRAELAALRARVDQLEAEFGPLARRYGRLAGATDLLPGQKWRRSAVQT